MNTSINPIWEHYMRPEVRDTILRYCQGNEAWRPLNGDDDWYIHEGNKVRLQGPEDYEMIISKYRTLYALLDLHDPSIKDEWEEWDEGRKAIKNPIGDWSTCMAYSLGCDIDSIRGPNGETIMDSPDIRKAVEDAGQFFVDYLRDRGLSQSVFCLYSGGGIYVLLHHELFRLGSIDVEERDEKGRILATAYNMLIGEIEYEFFKKHPEHSGKVKFDKLNNIKRKFKCIFAVHKKLPVAVIPLDPKHIEINFEDAKLPLSDKVIAAGGQWYREYNLDEIDSLKRLLDTHIERAKDEMEERKCRTGDYNIFRFPKPKAIEDFAPCIKNITANMGTGAGKHRALAILAAYLFQVGWTQENAYDLWEPLGKKAGVAPRIFDNWFGQMSCPNCSTIQKKDAGYPKMGLGEIGYCMPNGSCEGCRWPGGYIAPVDGLDLSNVIQYADTPLGGYGVDVDGILYRKVKNPKTEIIERAKICDGYARIEAQTRQENGDSAFTITGRGSNDGHIFSFDIEAADFADPRKLKARLVAQFGAKNVVIGLTGEVIQRISKNVKELRLITSPQWINNKPAVPGIELLPNLKFVLPGKVPVDVSSGDINIAKDCLRKLLDAWDAADTTIVLAAIMGAPLVARWFPDDRFGIMLRGVTGTGKTEFMKHVMAIYGPGYLQEANLLRWGEGATVNALLKMATHTGCLPLLVDNYKPVKENSAKILIGFIHAVLEGGEKQRLNRNSEFRDAPPFCCTPIITGEDYIEDPASQVRVLPIDWLQIINKEKLTSAQALAENLPAVGREWLSWLSSTNEVDGLKKGFASERTQCVNALSEAGCMNASRTGTAIALLKFIWRVMLKHPVLGEILKDHTVAFEEGLVRLQARLTEETMKAAEAEKFVNALSELAASGRGRIVAKFELDSVNPQPNVIGWYEHDGTACIFPEIARDMVRRMNGFNGQELTGTSLHRQLFQRGYICREKDRYTPTRSLNSKSVRVLVFKPGVLASARKTAEEPQVDFSDITIEEEIKRGEKRRAEREVHFREAARI